MFSAADHAFVRRAKFAKSFFVPTLSKATSSSVSLAIGVAETMIPVPNALWETVSPTRYVPAGAGVTRGFGAKPFGAPKGFAPKPRVTPAPAGTYRVGDTVSHKAFGTGIIVSATPMANDTLLEVAFDKVGTKKLFANFARLTKA